MVIKSKKKTPLEGEVIRKRKPRKDNYEPWMCDAIIEAAELGKHVPGMCKAIGIRSKDTFYRWCNKYPEFDKAYQEAKTASQDFYENVLLAGALGKIKGYNFNSVAMIMNNKFNDEYKRTGVGSNTEINIGSINSIDKLDTKALDSKIDQLQKQLNLIPTEETLEADD